VHRSCLLLAAARSRLAAGILTWNLEAAKR